MKWLLLVLVSLFGLSAAAITWEQHRDDDRAAVLFGILLFALCQCAFYWLARL